jgi:hypothetical protein
MAAMEKTDRLVWVVVIGGNRAVPDGDHLYCQSWGKYLTMKNSHPLKTQNETNTGMDTF